MKRKILTLTTLLIVIGLSFVSHVVKADSDAIEGGSESFILKNINLNKKVLTLADMKVAYNAATIFIDSNGVKQTVEDLKLNQVISYEYNYKARYYSMPTATKIVIKL